MRRIFWGFCRNRFLIDPLHYLSSRSDFGFEFAEIFASRGVRDSPTRRVGESMSRGVDDSPTRRVRESAFECLKENSASRGVNDSPNRRVGELSTPQLSESGSCYGESGITYSNFLKFFITLNS